MRDDKLRVGVRSTDLRSYGRRRGRRLSPRQERLLAELLPKVRIVVSDPPGLTPFAGAAGVGREWGQTPRVEPHGKSTDGDAGGPTSSAQLLNMVSDPEGLTPVETWLEIGFGGGEHLVWQAEHNPAVTLIGCEPFEDGVVKVLAAIEDKKLANIRIHPDDARPLIRALPEASISRAFILFPDPWPKKRHAKRRLVSRETLALLARILRPGAELRIATDIGDYARSTLVAMQVSPEFRWIAQSPADWRTRPDDWPPTRYEAKAMAAGRKSAYLRFLRV